MLPVNSEREEIVALLRHLSHDMSAPVRQMRFFTERLIEFAEEHDQANDQAQNIEWIQRSLGKLDSMLSVIST